MNSNNLALRSVHTTNFPAILQQLGISLAVSTYQSGKLILLREDAGTLNTHFRELPRPMGVAADERRMAVGSADRVLELRNVPAATARLDNPQKHDACYLPRWSHVTGDIDIHEMAYVGDELWFANTRFSCLCTLDRDHSFVPRWRPPFVSAYDLTDRCHLNGLALRDGQVRYVTALGETDTPAGWRQNKASGGILMDVQSGEPIRRGLSMPHSPRWYQDRLWVLESGKGTLATLDPETDILETVAELPGFTRGLDFWGPLAFVGLSQVRENATFAALPITERVQERNCGVWVVNIETRELLAFLRFEEAVQEIFAVSVLPGIQFPELIIADEELLAGTYVLPDAAMAEVAERPSVGPDEESAESLLARGNAAYESRDLDAAARSYERCLELAPDHLHARYNLGVVEVERERFPQAREVLMQVIQHDPAHADAHNNLGIVAQHELDLPQAIACYRKAITLRPDFADAHLNLGMALLMDGDFEEGWRESEWRWCTSRFTPFDCTKPRWDGAEITGGTVLVLTEQGAGDAIQFVRYLPRVAERCARVILVCTPDLLSLLGSVPGVDELRTPGDIPLGTFDAHVPLISLPYLFDTTLDSVPDTVPYLSVPEGKDTDAWVDDDACVFDDGDSRLRVGFVRAGSPTHNNDHNRSCPLNAFFPLLRTPGAVFYSLQKQAGDAQRAQLAALGVRDLGPRLRDFSDTAAAVARLDLVITVDTSVAHLAGALGRPVWTLIPNCPDWRWLLHRTDTPWYPSMRLFRQQEPKQWSPVLARVEQALQERLTTQQCTAALG